MRNANFFLVPREESKTEENPKYTVYNSFIQFCQFLQTAALLEYYINISIVQEYCIYFIHSTSNECF